jgi:antitoxin YefM
MTNTLTLKELRPELPRVIERIDKKFDRYLITKRGKPVVVMLSVDDYEALLETLDILEDDETMTRLKRGENEIRRGNTRSWDDVKKSHEAI